MLTHTAEKNYACLWCPYRSNLDSNLRKHCRNKHGENYPPIVRHSVGNRRPPSVNASSSRQPLRLTPSDVKLLLDDVSQQQLCTLMGGDGSDTPAVFYLDRDSESVFYLDRDSE